MITELRLHGFKCFSNPTTIPLARLTLIFGENSAGKSAITQALHLLAQTISADDNDGVPRLARGLFSTFGVFEDLVTKITGKARPRTLSIGATFEQLRQQDVRETDVRSFSIDCTFTPWKEVPGEGILQEAKLSLIPDGVRTPSLDTMHLRRRRQSAPRGGTQHVRYDFADDESRASLLRFEGSRGKPSTTPAHSIEFVTGGVHVHDKRGDHTDLCDGKLDEAMRTLSSILGDGLAHVGPVRARFARYTELGTGSRLQIAPDGSNVFHRLIVDRKIGRLGDLFERLGLPRPSAEPLADDNRVVKALIATSKGRGASKVPFDQVGVGMSQVLPILGHACYEVGQTVTVEQPELHLHGNLQAQLVELLAETAGLIGVRRKPRQQWIIETHSEQMLRRVQRLVRRGNLKAADVAILLVTAGGNVTRMEFLDDGEFAGPWPEGFFDSVFNDLLDAPPMGIH